MNIFGIAKMYQITNDTYQWQYTPDIFKQMQYAQHHFEETWIIYAQIWILSKFEFDGSNI